MAVFHADGIIIRSREYGEADRLITVFSRERGKLQAVAKGVRKPKSRQRAGVQLFTYADFLLHQGKSLHTVNQVSPKESFPHLWADLDKSMAATNMAELLDYAAAEAEPQPELFTLTLTAFFLLEHIDPILLQCAFALKLMGIMGYKPRLDECAECGQEIKDERIFFSPSAGGVLCSRCKNGLGNYVRAGSLAFMRRLGQGDMDKLDRLRWSEPMKEEVSLSVQRYCEESVEKSLKAWNMGNKMRGDVRLHLKKGKDEDTDVRRGME